MKKVPFGRCIGAAILGFLCAQPAQAREPFELDVTVATQRESFGFDSIDAVIDQLDPEALRQSFSARDPDRDSVSVTLDFRGLRGVSLDFGANTGLLGFAIPGLGISQTFGRGCNSSIDSTDCRQARKEALDQLKDFLETDKDLLKKLLTALARVSPIDPLAGNPGSLFSQRQTADFTQGFTHKVSQVWGCGTTAFNFSNDRPIQVAAVGGTTDIFAEAQARAAALQAENELGMGLLLQNTTAELSGGDFKSTTISIPLSYTAKFDSDPRKKFRVDLPLSTTDVGGAASYSVGLGFSYSHPLSDVWSLTPAIGVGATGSEDLGSAGGVGAYSLTSAYTWRLGGYALSMGNSVGNYQALGLKIGDIEAEADIKNTVFTNGFLLTGPNSLIAKNLVMEYSFVNTQITGDEVYSDSSNEIGIALGYINTELGVISSYLKAGLSYLVADGNDGDINSLRLNLAARF